MLENSLQERSNAQCELCNADQELGIYVVPPRVEDNPENCILICTQCQLQIKDTAMQDVHHWRCLNESMWSQIPAVQVMAWRLLNQLKSEGWAQDLFEMLYLEEETLSWAQEGQVENEGGNITAHIDSNGVLLSAGDTVTLVKDLNVKGTSFTAKRGTAVRNISLVVDTPEHIEGRVNGQQIVILTKFVKKS